MRFLNSVSIILWGLVVALSAPSDLVAQRGRGPVREGNKLFNEGRFEEARERYLDALRESPTSPLIRFNEGNALYESAEFQQALEAYQQAITSEDPSLQAKSWYNLGNTLYRNQMLQESADAYRQALKTDPTDPDSKHNLEWVLKQMEEQEQQDQSDQDQDDQQDENEQDQQNQDQESDQEQQEGENEGEQEQEQQQGDQPEQPDESEGEPQQQEGEQPPMSREEAERLLDAIDENPNEVRRQPPARARAVRPKKRW